jgi:bifunctional DNA-binding transcriptional regulator/antitoxin component of YhaV-PrlF toxin-antitoxin module
MEGESLSESRISTGFLTVVPKAVRERLRAREGDVVQWQLRGTEYIVRVRRRKTVTDIVGMISHGGDAVASKRAIQGTRARVR